MTGLLHIPKRWLLIQYVIYFDILVGIFALIHYFSASNSSIYETNSNETDNLLLTIHVLFFNCTQNAGCFYS